MSLTMPIKKTHRLVEILQGYSHGLTAKDVADRLGADPSNIGSQLSKPASYGIIKTTRRRIASDAIIEMLRPLLSNAN